MKTLIILILGAVIGFVIAWVWRKKKDSQRTDLIEETEEKKAENMQKVSAYLNEKGRATNNEIEQMLGVSHATAFRYLDEMEKVGQIRQVGRTGKGVFYEKA